MITDSWVFLQPCDLQKENKLLTSDTGKPLCLIKEKGCLKRDVNRDFFYYFLLKGNLAVFAEKSRFRFKNVKVNNFRSVFVLQCAIWCDSLLGRKTLELLSDYWPCMVNILFTAHWDPFISIFLMKEPLHVLGKKRIFMKDGGWKPHRRTCEWNWRHLNPAASTWVLELASEF